MNEIWKGITYQGENLAWRFEVSNFGRIRNNLNKHIYTPHPGGIGYLQICTSINGIRKNIKVHKAVAETFIPNPNKLYCINHKDCNKENNIIDNLEWCTSKFNYEHSVKNGLKTYNGFMGIHKMFGEDNPKSKLTQKDIIYIRNNYVPWDKNYGKKALANKFKVSGMCIYNIINKINWINIDSE